jgi:hypothetical protein
MNYNYGNLSQVRDSGLDTHDVEMVHQLRGSSNWSMNYNYGNLSQVRDSGLDTHDVEMVHQLRGSSNWSGPGTKGSL